jgi:hypothetical protein
MGAQLLLHDHDEEASEGTSLNRGGSDMGMDQIAWRTLNLVTLHLTEHGQDGNAAGSHEATIFQEIPGHKSYRYAVIGNQRVIVDSATYSVVYRLN